MSDIVSFDYSKISSEISIAIQAEAGAVKGWMRTSAEGVIKIGEALIRAKELLPHGSFNEWIEQEFGMSRTASFNFMRVAEKYGKCSIIEHLTPTVLYELAAPSTSDEVREVVEAKAEEGEHITVAEIKKIKAEAKEAWEQADRFKEQSDTLLQGQSELLEKAKSDAAAAVRKELNQARNEAQAAVKALEKAEQVALEKAQAQASDLAEAELNKRRAELAEAEKRLRQANAAIENKKEVTKNIEARVKEHQSYLKKMQGADIEARSILEENEVLNKALMTLMLTVNDLDHIHADQIYNKLENTADTCRKMAVALDALRPERKGRLNLSVIE